MQNNKFFKRQWYILKKVKHSIFVDIDTQFHRFSVLHLHAVHQRDFLLKTSRRMAIVHLARPMTPRDNLICDFVQLLAGIESVTSEIVKFHLRGYVCMCLWAEGGKTVHTASLPPATNSMPLWRKSEWYDTTNDIYILEGGFASRYVFCMNLFFSLIL